MSSHLRRMFSDCHKAYQPSSSFVQIFRSFVIVSISSSLVLSSIIFVTASVSSQVTGTVQCSWGELWRDFRDDRSSAGGSKSAEEGEDVEVW